VLGASDNDVVAGSEHGELPVVERPALGVDGFRDRRPRTRTR
jgi:hypothetical protein